MESWGYVSAEEKGYVTTNNDTLSPPCSGSNLGRTKSSFSGWELNTPCTFSNDISGHQTIENHQGFDELGIPELLGKQLLPHDNITRANTTTVVASPNALFGRGYSNSKLSNSVVDSNGRDSFIDLKLGRFDDHGDGAMDKALFSQGAPILSSSESSTAPKRVRASDLNSHTAYCQVYGCNKDLSSCKDYHKRHKVCEVHSKTATVIVDGIEQRFCQQCSRFHLLAEFDDGKRSCRKRLAGHNERRRKPQAGIHSGKAGRLLQPCGDSRFQGNILTSASFLCSKMLPSGVIPSEKYGMSGIWKPSKAEHGNGLRILSSMPMFNEHPQSISLFPSEVEKQFPFLHENGTSINTGSIFSESKNSVPRSLFQDISLGSEDFHIFDMASTVHGFSGISDTCALSLLSSQSQNSSSQSSGIPLAHRMVIPSSHGLRASGRQLSPILISDNNEILNFEMADGIFQGSDYVNSKDRLSCEDVATIDLLQLSSQLQQVEHQQQSLQVTQENDSSCTVRIT